MPKKNKNNTLKNIFNFLPIITLAGTMIIGFVRFQVQAEETAKKVDKADEKIEKAKEETEKDIKELEDKNNRLDKNITEQNVKLQYIQLLLEKVNDKMDKKQK